MLVELSATQIWGIIGLIVFSLVLAALLFGDLKVKAKVISKQPMSKINLSHDANTGAWQGSSEYSKLFEDFLREKKVLTRYLKAAYAGRTVRSLDEFIKHVHPSSYVRGAFVWSQNREGAEDFTQANSFWEEINTQWQDRLFSHGLKLPKDGKRT